MRSIRKALVDASHLVEQVKITRDELVQVTIDPWGRIRIQLDPEGFARCIHELGIPRSKVKLTAANGYAHADVKHKGVEWVSCDEIDVQAWQEALSQQQATIGTHDQQPRLEFAK